MAEKTEKKAVPEVKKPEEKEPAKAEKKPEEKEPAKAEKKPEKKPEAKEKAGKKPEKPEKPARIYTVSFKLSKVPRSQRASKAIHILRESLLRQTKAKDIVLDSSINREIWSHGMQKPPRSVKVAVSEQDDMLVAKIAK